MASQTMIAYRIANTPNSDTNTLRFSQAPLGNGNIVILVIALDVQLGDGDLLDARGAKGRDRLSEGGALARLEMALGADAVDGHAGGEPLLDVRHHAVGQLGGRRAVQVVVVDVQLGVRVGGAGCLETDADEVLA